jgi:signal transduction histidine kinase
MVGTLSISLFAFLLITDHVQKQYLLPVFEAMDELELESARSAWSEGGASAVSSYVGRLNHVFGSLHYILNSDGVDIVTGQRRPDLLPPSKSRSSRGRVNGQYVVTHQSADGRYWLIAVDSRQPSRWTLYPYYFLVIAATGVLCWLAALGVIAPLRKVTTAVDRFGRGDLDARVNARRRDEIGVLASSFDGMADRLQTLLVSERRLLQDISHELRSPLTRLKLAVRLARTAADQNSALDRVEREANRLTALVSEIVEMTRMEGDPQSRRMQPINIGHVVEETVDDCRVEAQLFRGCDIRVQGQLSSEVSGDQELLRRALENVVRNAIRYSPEHGAIDVTLAEELHYTTIAIRDYGPGVPAESLAEIFEPFFRVNDARDEETGGIGLGLSIARRAVRLHRGTITAQNATPGLRVQIAVPRLTAQSSQKDLAQ